MKRANPTILLMLWLTAAYAASFVGMQGVLRGIGTLYPALVKPSWNPPAWLFAPVWTILYALLGIAAWRVSRTEGRATGALAAWWTQIGLNALWPWLFFGFGRLSLAFATAVALWIALLVTTILFARRDRLAAWLLVPALAWTGFAALLNLALWRLNP